jgi:hypothetical protein
MREDGRTARHRAQAETRAKRRRAAARIANAQDYAERWDAERRRLVTEARGVASDPSSTDAQVEAVLAEIRAFDQTRAPSAAVRRNARKQAGLRRSAVPGDLFSGSQRELFEGDAPRVIDAGGSERIAELEEGEGR